MPCFRKGCQILIAVTLLAVLFTASVSMSVGAAEADAGETTSEVPCANFTYSPESPNIGDTVTFRVSPLSSPVCKVHYVEGYIRSYLWYFDGSPVASDSGRKTERVYEEPGNYTIALVATDHRGVQTRYEQTVKVTELRPTAEFSYTPDEPNVGREVGFDASDSFNPEGAIDEYRWEMGDGTTRTGRTTSHTYEESGEYDVVLTVEGDDGKTARTTDTVEVGDVTDPLTSEIRFERLPNALTVGDEITVDGSGSRSPQGEIQSYIWEFGDGTVKQGATASHSYTEPGTYELTLEVNDGTETDSTTEEVTVVENPIVPEITHSPPEDLTEGDTISFDASGSSSTEGSINEFRWDFGDGTQATGETVEHSYEEFGTYEVTVEISAGDKTAEESITLTVSPSEEGEGLNGFGVGVSVVALVLTVIVAGRSRRNDG
ncbi:MAG: PKD domain-containing protein [Halobacteriales archaeon]|nr:PKD domain-containing protein [Halobacteriales archaeon]